jgi:hypothetical protein
MTWGETSMWRQPRTETGSRASSVAATTTMPTASGAAGAAMGSPSSSVAAPSALPVALDAAMLGDDDDGGVDEAAARVFLNAAALAAHQAAAAASALSADMAAETTANWSASSAAAPAPPIQEEADEDDSSSSSSSSSASDASSRDPRQPAAVQRPSVPPPLGVRGGDGVSSAAVSGSKRGRSDGEENGQLPEDVGGPSGAAAGDDGTTGCGSATARRKQRRYVPRFQPPTLFHKLTEDQRLHDTGLVLQALRFLVHRSFFESS